MFMYRTTRASESIPTQIVFEGFGSEGLIEATSKVGFSACPGPRLCLPGLSTPSGIVVGLPVRVKGRTGRFCYHDCGNGQSTVNFRAWERVFILFAATAAAMTGAIPVQPASVTTTPGQLITVDVQVGTVSDLYAGQFDLSFDPSIVTAVAVTQGDFLSTGGSTFFIPGSIDNTAGTITFNADTRETEIAGVSGSGLLAQVQFKAVALGASAVTIANVYLLDSQGNPIDAAAGDGTITVAAVQAHPAFFTGEVSLTNGVYYLQFPGDGNLFGYYNYQAFPWFYHYDLGFEYFIDANDGKGSAYWYDSASGHWFYTSPSLFPELYDFTASAWLYYFPDTKNPGHYTANPRYFANLGTGTIFTM